MDRCQLNASFSFLKMMQYWSFKVPSRIFHLSTGLFLILLLCLHRLKEPFPQHQLQCWLLKTWRDWVWGKMLGKLLASSVFGSTPACLMGWALWVKLQPPLRIPWNETALMLKALWVRQHCADKPKTWRLVWLKYFRYDHPYDIWPTLDLWCQRLHLRTWWKVPLSSQLLSSSSPPSPPTILQISSSQHLPGRTGRTPWGQMWMRRRLHCMHLAADGDGRILQPCNVLPCCLQRCHHRLVLPVPKNSLPRCKYLVSSTINILAE